MPIIKLILLPPKKILKKIFQLYDLVSIQFFKYFNFEKNLSFKSASEYSQYPEFVLKAALDYKTYKIFRRHPIYTNILEHVSKEMEKVSFSQIIILWEEQCL